MKSSIFSLHFFAFSSDSCPPPSFLNVPPALRRGKLPSSRKLPNEMSSFENGKWKMRVIVNRMIVWRTYQSVGRGKGVVAAEVPPLEADVEEGVDEVEDEDDDVL